MTLNLALGTCACIAASLAMALPLSSQESGFTIPVTVGGAALYTHRLQNDDPAASPLTGGARGVIYPSVTLGAHWFGYAAVQLTASPYFGFELNEASREFKLKVLQAYAGYRIQNGNKTLIVKGGQLSSAFGAFPLRYDDASNPLIDVPSSYGASEYGSYPVTLYGLPGIEADASVGRFDSRFQFTNSSAANPKGLLSHDQHPNWTAGAGFTIVQGFRVGVSVSHGAYLQIGRFLRPDENAANWPATPAGLDAQWAHGRWNVSAEWQRFPYPYPRYVISPVVTHRYIETRVVLNPRLYAAARIGEVSFGRFQKDGMAASAQLAPNRFLHEYTLGYRLNRAQLLKIGYEIVRFKPVPGAHDNVAAVQLVTSWRGFSSLLNRQRADSAPEAESTAY